MKNTLRRFFLYKYTECEALKEYLEEMALKGWMLKDINTYFTFERMEPQKVVYSVQVFDQASIYDTRLEDKAREYIDYCYEAGWQFVCSTGKIHVFVAIKENPVPIETDEALKYETIKKGIWKQSAYQWFALPFIMISNVGIQYFWNYESFVTMYYGLFMVLITLLLLVIIGSQIISFAIWCKRAKRNLANGEKLPSFTQKDLKRRSRIRLIPILLSLAVIIFIGILSYLESDYFVAGTLFFAVVMIVLVWGSTIWYQKRKLSRAENIAIPIAVGVVLSGVCVMFILVLVVGFSHENSKVYAEGNTVSVMGNSKVPLTLEDVGLKPEKYRDTNKYVNETVFAKCISCDDGSTAALGDETKGVDYRVFESRFDFIVRRYIQSKTTGFHFSYKQGNASEWGAEKVFVPLNQPRDYIVVVYKNCVFLYRGDAPLNGALISKIRSKLNLN